MKGAAESMKGMARQKKEDSNSLRDNSVDMSSDQQSEGIVELDNLKKPCRFDNRKNERSE